MVFKHNNNNNSNSNSNSNTGNTKFDFINSELHKIREDNLYRELRYGVSTGSSIIIKNKRLVNLCSNDYLAIPVYDNKNNDYSNNDVSLKQIQSSSRLISGNDKSFKKLERVLARHKSQQGSLIYPTGYMANLGVISAVIKKGDTVFSDQLNHASIIDSCKLSNAKVQVYKHNDVEDLNKKLRQCKGRKFVVTEGVFSMDGDIPPLKEIVEIAKDSDAITMVDDAHGDFVIGRDGRGTPDHLGVAKDIDIYTSSLSKGLGSFGGYVASQNNVIDYCINRSKSFIYTSALPSFLVKYTQAKIESKDRARQRRKLKKNTTKITKGLTEIGYEIRSNTQIIPIILRDEKRAMDFGDFLLAGGVFVQPIRYPTVPKNQARLRISVTAWLSDADIEKALEVFQRGFKKFCR